MFEPLVPILIFLLTSGVKEFFEKVLGRAVPASTSAIIAAAVTSLVLFANALGALLPKETLPVVATVVTLLVQLFAAFGVHATIKVFAR